MDRSTIEGIGGMTFAVVIVVTFACFLWMAHEGGRKSWWHDRPAGIVTHEGKLFRLMPVEKEYREGK